MRYMIIVKATRDSEAGVMPTEEMLSCMVDYHEQLAKAGVLVDASGLQATSKGWRVEFRGDHRSVVDGPFAETKELIAGYTIIRVNSEAEAREWTRKFPQVSESRARRRGLHDRSPAHVRSRGLRTQRGRAALSRHSGQRPPGGEQLNVTRGRFA
jgi:hypothetical protein